VKYSGGADVQWRKKRHRHTFRGAQMKNAILTCGLILGTLAGLQASAQQAAIFELAPGCFDSQRFKSNSEEYSLMQSSRLNYYFEHDFSKCQWLRQDRSFISKFVNAMMIQDVADTADRQHAAYGDTAFYENETKNQISIYSKDWFVRPRLLIHLNAEEIANRAREFHENAQSLPTQKESDPSFESKLRAWFHL
jgi:hypothetical protein